MYEKLGESRLQAWALESRTRYALVQTAISAGIVLGLGAFFGGIDSLSDNMWFTIVVVLIAFVLNAWVWYPRAKRKHDPSWVSSTSSR